MISVIIPAHNAADTIRAALDSVAAQTCRDLEIIVVDDASTDNTAAAVRKWCQVSDVRFQVSGFSPHPSPALRLFSLSHNSGPAAARNRGLMAARGEWVAFLDADDVWLPWCLEDQSHVASLFPDAALVCGVAVCGNISDCRRQPVAENRCRRIELLDFVEGNPVCTSTVLARRETVMGVGAFDEQFRGPEDMDLWIRVAAVGAIVKSDAPVVWYQPRVGTLSMDADRLLPQVLRVYEKAFGPGGKLEPYRHLRRRAIAARYVSAALTHFVVGQRVKAVAALLRSWRIWPRRTKAEHERPLSRLILLARIMLNRRDDVESRLAPRARDIPGSPEETGGARCPSEPPDTSHL